MGKNNKRIKEALRRQIDPWGSDEIKDYDKLFKEFGLNKFPDSYRNVINSYLFKRPGIVIAERDFDKIVEKIRENEPFIVVTGIASSGPLHLGHKVVVDIVKTFKELNGRVYFAICDIDAYVSRPDKKVPSLKKAKEFAVENVAHVLALGLDEQDIYVQSQKENRYYEFSYELSKKITLNTLKAVYGHLDLGKIAANLLQYTDILHPQLEEYEGKMPSVTPIGLDQDPHARITRDIARRLPYDFELPSFLYINHQPGLQRGSKMSSSEPENSILLSDDIEKVKKKIYNAFTGGRNTLKEQKMYGGNPDICRVCDLLKYHLPDTKKLNDLIINCKEGSLVCGDCKKICFEYIENFLSKHQEKFYKYKSKAEKLVYGE